MKRFLLALLLLVAVTAQGGRNFLGTIAEDATIIFYWETFDDNGASVTRATDGTVKLIREDGTDCTAGAITDAEDSLDTGVHKVTVDTSGNVNCTVGSTYFVWIDGAVIDGDTVNAVIGTFSIEDRFVNVTQIESADATDQIRDSVVDDSTRIDASSVNAVEAKADSILADTGTDGVVVAAASKTGYALSATGLNLITFNIDGVSQTIVNAIRLAVRQIVGDMTITGTTLTYTDADGTVTTFTLNSATSPTKRTRQ